MQWAWRIGGGLVLLAAASSSWALDGSLLALRSNGASPGGNAWRLDDNGYVGTYITLAAPGSVTVTANALGPAAERMNIVIGDARMGWDVGTTAADYAHTFDLPAGTHFVRTEYANAHLSQSLTVNSLNVTGATISNTSNATNALAAAQTYTQNYRKGNATIQLPDGWSGHPFQVKLKQHAFNFGVSVPSPFGGPDVLAANPTPTSTAGQFQQKLKDNKLNSLTPENAGKWDQNEGVRDVLTRDTVNPNGGPNIPYMDRISDFAQANDLRYRAHNVIWGRNPQGGANQQPSWVSTMSANPNNIDSVSGKLNSLALRDEISERVQYYVADRASRFYEVDVYNESYHTGSNQGHSSTTYWELYGASGIAEIYKEAKDAAAGRAKMFVNEYSVFQTGGDNYANWYARHIESLQNAGRTAFGENVVEGIGIQYYASSTLSNHSAARIYATLNNLAVQDLPMALTEWGVGGSGEADSATKEATAATILDQTARLVFGMPGMTGLTHWSMRLNPSGFAPIGSLYDNNWTIRDTGTTWQQLMTEWNTDVVVNVAADGTLEFNGFYGDYEVIINGQGYPLTLVKGTNDFELNIPAPNPGDFNADGKVDDADLGVWQANFGLHELALHAHGDADLDGDVDSDDWLTWQVNYGAGVPAAAAVPEPGGTLLAGVVLMAFVGTARRDS
jgi:GH35 family endo-1,4-beta-xylanase